jgi:hypothetical protein
MQNANQGGYRSLFWPMLLIGVGIVWLLGNMGVISAFDPLWLLRLWPLALIAIGLDLMFGRRSPVIGGLLGILVIGAMVALMLLGPALNLPQASAVEQRSLTASLDGVSAATIRLDFSVYPTTLRALSDSDKLLDAQIGYQGTLDFSSSSVNGEAQVSLRHSGLTGWWFTPSLTSAPLRWQIGLSPRLPLTLDLKLGSGSSEIDLTGLQLKALTVDGASGSTRLVLPASTGSYEAVYEGSSGSLGLILPAETNLALNLHGSSGSLDISLPAGAAVRLDVRDNGSGSVSPAGGMERLSGKAGEDRGVWETPGYAQAAKKITITVDNVGSGSISLH